MSTCLALVVVTMLSTAAPSAPSASAPPAPAGPQAVQYVQVQYRNVLKSNTLGVQAVPNIAKTMATSFLSNVVGGLLSNLNPVLGFLAHKIIDKMTSKMTTPPPQPSKSNVKVEAEFEATTTIAPARTRTDVGDISTIIQCDKQQIIVADNTSKTYSAQSFSDSLNDPDSGNNGGAFNGPTDLSQQVIVPQPDDGTETIAGLLSHHDVITAPLESGFGYLKSDLWFADVPMPNACSSPAKEPGPAAAPQASAAPATVRIPLRSVQVSQMFFSAPAPAPSLTPNASASSAPYRDPVLDTPGIAWIETTSVTHLPYDASYFDVPAGYALGTPEPSPSP